MLFQTQTTQSSTNLYSLVNNISIVDAKTKSQGGHAYEYDYYAIKCEKRKEERWTGQRYWYTGRIRMSDTQDK